MADNGVRKVIEIHVFTPEPAVIPIAGPQAGAALTRDLSRWARPRALATTHPQESVFCLALVLALDALFQFRQLSLDGLEVRAPTVRKLRSSPGRERNADAGRVIASNYEAEGALDEGAG